MKTENLTWAEAIRAYANGERIRDGCGFDYWLDGDNACSVMDGIKHNELDLSPAAAPFSIVKPEPKSLTFEQATLDSRIGMPLSVAKRFWDDGKSEIELEGAIAMLLLDLAERRGWTITDASQ